MPDIFLEHPPVVICQCLVPCFQPILDADGKLAETSGCLRPTGHDGEHSLDGSPDLTYRDPPTIVGPRILLRAEQPGGVFRGTCWRCGAEYALGGVALSAQAASALREPDPEPGICKRCGLLAPLLDGLCGSCADDLRMEQQADELQDTAMPTHETVEF